MASVTGNDSAVVPARSAAGKRRASSSQATSPKATLSNTAGGVLAERDALAPPSWWEGSRLRQLGAVLGINIALHVLVLLALATILLPADIKEQLFSIVATPADEPEPEMIFETVEMPETLEDLEEVTDPVETAAEAVEDDPQPVELDINDLEPSLAMEDSTLDAPDIKLSSDTAGRSAAAKSMLVQKFGGTAESEQAVALGLKWVASIQQKDGSWTFKEIGGAPDAGDFENDRMAATGCALLAFLGGGHTHEKDGPYKEAVGKGLDYLLKNVEITPAGGNFSGGVKNTGGHDYSLYAQGLVAISLAEAHGMTKDRRLRRAAESAITFIINAQDPKGGGWRYVPQQAGDTSAVGWQMMALKGGQAAKLRIPPNVFLGVSAFLDSTAGAGGATYGYTNPTDRGPADACTAIGLLCRMYLGWKRDNPGLKKGVEILSNAGPDDDMYRNYYATQVLHHWGGDEWTKWNTKMRERLITRQVKEGQPGAGSWKPGKQHGNAGRLLETCLSIMTLEVYYRHLPLYERADVQVDF